MGVFFEKCNDGYKDNITGEHKLLLTNSDMILDIIGTHSRIDWILLDVIFELMMSGDEYWLSSKMKARLTTINKLLFNVINTEEFGDVKAYADMIQRTKVLYDLDYTGMVRSYIDNNLKLSFGKKVKKLHEAPDNNVVKTTEELYQDLRAMGGIRNTVAHSDLAMNITPSHLRQEQIERLNIDYKNKYLSINDLYENYIFLVEKWKGLFSADINYLLGEANE